MYYYNKDKNNFTVEFDSEGADNTRKDAAMIRAADIVRTLDMSRVERNQALYRELEEESASGNGRPGLTGTILKSTGAAMMVLVVVMCLSFVIPKLFGYNAYVVVSGSMEPTIPVGSLVYAHETDPSTLNEGDVIVFINPERGTTPITHRVMSNDTASQTIVTKGDANEREDMNPATYDNVIGKVMYHMPRVGFAASFMTSALGKLIMALVMLEAWLLIEIGRRKAVRS